MQMFNTGRSAAGTTSNAQRHQADMLAFLRKPSPTEQVRSEQQPVMVPSVRVGWEEDYKLMHANGDDQFIMDEFFPEDIERLTELFGDNPITF